MLPICTSSPYPVILVRAATLTLSFQKNFRGVTPAFLGGRSLRVDRLVVFSWARESRFSHEALRARTATNASSTLASTMATSEDTHAQLSMEKLKSTDKLTVVDENGEKVRFESLYQDKKAVIIFVRVCKLAL